MMPESAEICELSIQHDNLSVRDAVLPVGGSRSRLDASGHYLWVPVLQVWVCLGWKNGNLYLYLAHPYPVPVWVCYTHDNHY